MNKDGNITNRLPADVWGFALGAAATWTQIVLLREALVAAGGNEISIALSLGSWLVGVCVGAAIAGSRVPGGRFYRKMHSFPSFLGLMLVLCSVAGIGVLRNTGAIMNISAGAALSVGQAAVVCTLSLLPAGAVIGALFVSLSGLQAQCSGTVLRLYILEALGALAAGGMFTFVLAGRTGALALTGLCSLVLASAGIFHTAAVFSRMKLVLFVCLAASGTALVMPAAGGRLERHLLDAAWEHTGGRGKIQARKETKYHRLELGRESEQFNLYANGRYVWSFPDSFGRRPLIHLALSQHPAPSSLLILGCAPVDDVPAAFSHLVKYVECSTGDPGVIPFLVPFFTEQTREALGSKSLKIVHGDGRRHMNMLKKDSVDVIALFAPPPETLASNRYFTSQAFERARYAVGEKGVLAVNLPGGPGRFGSGTASLVKSILKAAREHFPFQALSAGEGLVAFMSATRGIVTEDEKTLAARWKKRRVRDAAFSEHHFSVYFQPGMAGEVRRQLKKATAFMNTDDVPRAIISALARSVKLGDDDLSGAVFFFRHLNVYFLLLLLVPLVVPLALAFMRPRGKSSARTSSLVCIASTGACGMAMEVVLLYAFQAASGHLYEAIGLLIALFMAGLSAGSALGGAWVRKLPAFSAGLRAEGFMICVLLVTPLFLWHAAASIMLCGVFLFFAGAATGAGFGPFLRIASSAKENEPANAGAVNAADHLGGAVGAFAAGLLLVPLLGVRMSLVALVLAKATSAAGLILARRTTTG